MNDQVLSVEQMQELIALGVDISKASCCWCKVATPNRIGYIWTILPEHLNKCDEEHIPTFTLQNILEYLPKQIKVGKTIVCTPEFSLDSVGYYDYDSCFTLISFKEKTLLLSFFNLLKWCKQNKHI